MREQRNTTTLGAPSIILGLKKFSELLLREVGLTQDGTKSPASQFLMERHDDSPAVSVPQLRVATSLPDL